MQPRTKDGVSFGGVWLGKILKTDENEPRGDRAGKVKVEIPAVYGENVPEDKLPWAYPILIGPVNPQKRSGIWGLPKKDSYVAVLFEQGNPQCPRWLGGWVQPGKIPHPFINSEGDKYGKIFAIRTVDKMMFRMVEGERMEFYLGESGKFQDDEWVPDGQHNEHDTFIKLDKKRKRLEIRSKYEISITCKAGIKIKATKCSLRLMPNGSADAESGEWSNDEGSETPRFQLTVIDPEAKQGARIIVEPGKLIGRAKETRGFEDS